MMVGLSFCAYSIVSIFAKDYPQLSDLQDRSDGALKELLEVLVPSRVGG